MVEVSRSRAALLSLVALSLCLLAATGLLAASVPGTADATATDLAWAAGWSAYALVGAVLAWHRPRHPVGWLFLATGVLVGLAAALDVAAFAVADERGTGDGLVAVLRVVQQALFGPAFALVPAALLLFPDGRAAAPWRRRALAAVAVVAALELAGSLVEPGPVGESLPVDNPWGVDALAGAAAVADGLAAVVLPLAVLLALGALAVSARRARGRARAQHAWLLAGVLATAVVPLGGLLVEDALRLDLSTVGPLLSAATVPLLPVAVAVAVLRHDLLDVGLVLRRSVVWLLLTAAALGGWVAVAAGLGATLDADERAAALLGALVALTAVPVGTRLQAAVDRRVYGDRGDPETAVARLARRLAAAVEPDQVPAVVVDSVRDALRLPYAAVVLEDGDVAAASGEQPAWQVHALPLTAHGRDVGRLLVAQPGPREALAEAELALLADLAGSVGLAVESVRLTRELQRSREDLVLAREEERRRLRNDLHDGLGPVLAGVLLRLGVARERCDDAQLTSDLTAAQDRLADAVADLRRLVDGLRPPALDELGLEGAVRAHLDALSGGGSPQLALHLPGPLPALPAATEVAAYRVLAEAVTNALRHAGARQVAVRLVAEPEALLLEVVDDGTARPGPDGVGRRSMRQRCLELGGSCDYLTTDDGGTLVAARLPLQRESA